MKIKINYYTQRLLKHNALYILAFVVLIFLFIYSIYTFSGEYMGNTQKIAEANTKIQELVNRKKTLESLISLNYSDIKDYNLILNKLIPDSEDYFSIIYALERLSQQTGFIIANYMINLDMSQADHLSITVNGDGDVNAFLKFLNEYNFASGRLITMNDFDFKNKGVQYKLNLNFYSKQVLKDIAQLGQINPKDLEFMQDIRSKVDFILKSPATPQTPSEQDINYTTTQELF